MPSIDQLSDVVDWRLCLGCGACAYICPDRRVNLLDFEAEGIRPVVAGADCGQCRDCLDVCPGVRSDYSVVANEVARMSNRAAAAVVPGVDAAFIKEWGPVTGIWEGHAADEEIRFKGSSGGALTALAAYCLEVLGMHGVLHIAQDEKDPLRNRTQLSRTRAELLAAAGSRYAPASVGNGLGLVEQAPSPCVIIGKPSEIAAVENARRMRPQLDARVGVTLSFFCAETPATRGTAELARQMGVPPTELGRLRYRGHGWPGHFAPHRRGETRPAGQMTYRESWSFLQAYRPWATHQWPDGAGELADISCGDPWYEEPDGKNPGSSLIVARTARGRTIVEGAMRAGHLRLTPAESWKVARSQLNLLEKKGAVWGRRLAARSLGLPLTSLSGLDLRHSWRLLGWRAKARALMGTMRRILTRGLRHPCLLDPAKGVPLAEPCIGEHPNGATTLNRHARADGRG